jgi:hypothetical protein
MADIVVDEDICPKTGVVHTPDWSTVTVTHDGEAYIDVNCVNCGRSGCIGSAKTLTEGISW